MGWTQEAAAAIAGTGRACVSEMELAWPDEETAAMHDLHKCTFSGLYCVVDDDKEHEGNYCFLGSRHDS